MLISRLRKRNIFGRRKERDGGFTLIELLVVVTILGILAVVVVMALSGIGDKGKSAASATDATILQTAEQAACAYQPPPGAPSSTQANVPPSAFEDSPQLQRDGFLASVGQYNDVDMAPINGGQTCTGTSNNNNIPTSYAMFSPTQTSYPLTVDSCDLIPNAAGANSQVLTTLGAAPQHALAVDNYAYEMMLVMGLGNVAYYDSTPADAAAMIANLPSSLQNAATGYLLSNSGTAAGHNLLTPGNGDTNTSTGTTDDPEGSDAIDPGFLSTNGIDLVYTVIPKNLQVKGSSPVQWSVGTNGIITGTTTAVDTDPANVVGVPAYLGFNGDGGEYPAEYQCFNAPTYPAGDTLAGQPLPVNTLETLYHEARTLGTMFNAQNTAMQVIGPMKTAIASDLVKAKSIFNTNQVSVAALDTRLTGVISGKTAEVSDVFDGTSGVNAALTSAGGTNVLTNVWPGGTGASGDSNYEALASYAPLKPQLLVLMTDGPVYDGLATIGGDGLCTPASGYACTTDPTCSLMASAVAANTSLASIPYVCVSYYDLGSNRPRALTAIQAVASAIQALPNASPGQNLTPSNYVT